MNTRPGGTRNATESENMKTENELNWREVTIHFGKKNGTKLGNLSARDLKWWTENWSPNDRFCKSKLTTTRSIPAYDYEDDDGEMCHVAAHDVTEKTADVDNCPDCRLAAALKIGAAEKAAEEKHAREHRLAPLPATLGCEFRAGEKIRRQVRVEKVSSWTTEFNRKKVTQYGAYLRNCDALFYWKSSSMPDEMTEGAELEIEGTIKDCFLTKTEPSERAVALLRVKIVGGKILTPKAALVLFCDGKSSAQRIAVCDANGAPVFADHFSGDATAGDNTDHELGAALKAFELADAARVAAGHDCIALELRFDAKWMEGMVGKAAPLRAFARAHGLKVTMTHIAGASNPADAWTVGGGQICKPVNL